MNSLKKCSFFVIVFFIMNLAIFSVASSKPIRIQGRITDNKGNPISGSPQVRFQIFDAATGGAMVWGETSAQIVETNASGLFSKEVGPIPSEVFTQGRELFLQISLDVFGELKPLNPRQKLSSTPFAYWSETSAESAIAASVKDNTISSEKIQSNAVQQNHLAPNSVNSAAIIDGAINKGEIAADAVDSPRIEDRSIQSTDIGLTAVKRENIADGAIGGPQLDTNAVQALHIVNGSISTGKISRNAVGTNELATSAVTTNEILNGTISREDVYLSSFLSNGFGFVPQGGIILSIDPNGCPPGYALVERMKEAIPVGAFHGNSRPNTRHVAGTDLERWNFDNKAETPDRDDPKAFTVDFCQKI